VTSVDVLTTIGAGLGAGIPVGWAALRQLGKLITLVERAVTALETIADRLKTAEYVRIAPRAAAGQ
jgi:shikimate 5-dehydrogenase